MSRRQAEKPFPWPVLVATLVGLFTGYIVARVTSNTAGEVYVHRTIITADSLIIEAIQPGPMELGADSLALEPGRGVEWRQVNVVNKRTRPVTILLREGRIDL